MGLFPSKQLSVADRLSQGFTLIEIVAALVLLGILTSVAGFGLVRVVDGYVFSRENTEMTQKAQLALARMTREIVELLDIEVAEKDKIVIQTHSDSDKRTKRTIGFDNNAVRVATDEETLNDAPVLVADVEKLEFTFFANDGSLWTVGKSLEDLSMVDMALELRRSNGSTMVFWARAAPRNTKNIGGASVTPGARPPVAANYNLCFISILKGQVEK